jgi:16S rRNA (cytosine1402-N4)-methyltransferase
VSDWGHVSVLLDEAVSFLDPKDGEVMVDCTLGAGGHAEALLERADCTVVGIDRDPVALRTAGARLARFGGRFVPVHGRFGDLADHLDKLGLDGVHGVLADLGVSSLQVDTADRGFSFRSAGPIDMRMDPSADSSAADFVGHADEDVLARVIEEYGEERHARRIARVIVQGRPWRDTKHLADAIAAAVPDKGPHRIHPATRTFQAIRIHVNDELGQLERLLPAAVDALLPGGRLAVISFHSLEDRRVKQFLARESGRGSPRDPYGNPLTKPRLASRPKPTVPLPTDPNPRARSARLRTALRLP